MVAAGLTAATPHMISASINALSRLLFEFKGESSFPFLLLATPTLCSSSPSLSLGPIASRFLSLSIAHHPFSDELSLVLASALFPLPLARSLTDPQTPSQPQQSRN